jgi:hypothetical protein
MVGKMKEGVSMICAIVRKQMRGLAHRSLAFASEMGGQG